MPRHFTLFSKMAPFSYLHRYVLYLNVINILRSKAVSTPSPSNPNSSHTIPQHPQPDLYHTKHVNHVFMFISYKAISSPLVAAVTFAAAVAVVTLAGTGVEVVMGERGGATVSIRNTSDITHFD